MAIGQLEMIVNQLDSLTRDELVTLIKKAAELLEQKLTATERPATNYVSFIGAGKGVFATPEEADRFIREERDAWEE